MNVLSIGNSFSQDAQRYLFQIAKAGGMTLNCFNLFVSGCSLERHYQNMLANSRSYTLEMNGQSTGFLVSLEEALCNREWDVVTLQQASLCSSDYATYQPYLKELAAFVRRLVPTAKVVIHQTWAYEQGSQRLTERMGYADYKDMLADVANAYRQAAKDIDADGIIPSGEVFGAILQNGIDKVHRDTYHASCGVGRYALGLTWYRFLTGNSIDKNKFCAFDEAVSAEQIAVVKKSVSQIAKQYGI